MSRATIVLGGVFALSFVLLAGALQTCATSSVAASSEWQMVSFRKDVNPILQRNCAVCHSPGGEGYKKSGFSVQSYQAVMKGTRYGATVIPGSSVSSSLVLLIKHGANPSINMPKAFNAKAESHEKSVTVSGQAESLSAQDVRLISGWIDQGAKNN